MSVLSPQQSDGLLRSLGATLKLLSAQSINTAQEAAVPVLQVANETALDARSTLKDLGGDVALAVVRAQASGWDAAQCAQGRYAIQWRLSWSRSHVPPLMPIYCLLNRQREAGASGNPTGADEVGRLHSAGGGAGARAGRRHRESDPGRTAAHRHGDGGRGGLFKGHRHHYVSSRGGR